MIKTKETSDLDINVLLFCKVVANLFFLAIFNNNSVIQNTMKKLVQYKQYKFLSIKTITKLSSINHS